MPKQRILVPLPDRDFDVTEVAVPWHVLSAAGRELVFATETGKTPAGDPLLLRGVIFGQLGADPEPKRFYDELTQARAFIEPIAWADIEPASFDALLLAGGHAPGMRQYLGSEPLQRKVAEFWKLGRPVAAICHGVLVLARARDPETGKSLLARRRTTCLPKYLEALAYGLTFWKLGRYYRTYPEYLEDEVRRALDDPAEQFVRGPINLGKRGSASDHRPALVVEDENYLSARWPGDAYLFAERFLTKLDAERPVTADGRSEHRDRIRPE
jgi:putative intracellular protease/amidase